MTKPSSLRHADLYHTGVVVDDLESAKSKFGALFGVTWIEGGAEVRLITDDGLRIVKTAYALSAEGPHHVELVQSVPGTLYKEGGGSTAHHLGYWADDVLAASAGLSADGLPRAAAITLRDENEPPICVYHRAAEGLYIELVSRALRPFLLGLKV